MERNGSKRLGIGRFFIIEFFIKEYYRLGYCLIRCWHLLCEI